MNINRTCAYLVSGIVALNAVGCGSEPIGSGQTDEAAVEQSQEALLLYSYGGPVGTPFRTAGGNYYAAYMRNGWYIDQIAFYYKNEFGTPFMTGVYGGMGGSSPPWDICPAGQFIIGMYGNHTKGQHINQLGIVCGTTDYKVRSYLPLHGSQPGAYSFVSLCGRYNIVKGVLGYSDSIVNQIQLDCGPMDAVIY